jgi:hypothetical protein
MSDGSMETETLAWVYLDQGHPERAAPIFERLLAENPGQASAADGLEKCRAQMGVRKTEKGMDERVRLRFLRRMLSNLTGEPIEEEHARPEGSQASLQSGIPATERDQAPSPRERKLKLLRSLLDRLSNAKSGASG